MKSSSVLSKKDIQHMADLSVLHLSESELISYTKQLSETVDYVESISQVSPVKKHASEPEKTTHVTRSDEIDTKRTLSQSQALANSSKRQGDYFVVKRIL